MSDESKRVAYPLNVPGDFYVENGMCIACSAPEPEAPDLMSHDETNHHHCYFKCQPQTSAEIEKAIRAVRVGCCGAVRYGGHDPQIIKQLCFLGSADDCDHS